ncbi:MAG: hypothetical protein PHH60_00365, partial [Candidatus Margulisbacteria bacterium]|nr:hypothetical protein [Candidatus Margulisiibacteriota bacterium]
SFGNVTSVTPRSFTGNFSNYNYQIVMTYVTTSELNNPATGTTNFKNVKVRVWGGPVDQLGTVEIVSLVTTYETH